MKKNIYLFIYVFITLYTNIPRNKKDVCDIIDFVFKKRVRNKIAFSDTSVYSTTKGEKRFFTIELLKTTTVTTMFFHNW